MKFQHTAAQRRLLIEIDPVLSKGDVSTHSRAEAAAESVIILQFFVIVSTHSRAEAAACIFRSFVNIKNLFQHTAAQRRLPLFVNKRLNKF